MVHEQRGNSDDAVRLGPGSDARTSYNAPQRRGCARCWCAQAVGEYTGSMAMNACAI